VASDMPKVLVCMTQGYRKCWDGETPPGSRLGATYEARILRQRVYQAGSKIPFLRVVIFDEADREFVPNPLGGLHAFHAEADYTDLVAWLAADQPVGARACTVRWPAESPDFSWCLADRRDEFTHVRAMLSGKTAERILLVNGISSVGKTTFVHHVSDYARSVGISYARLDIKGCPSFDDVMDSLANQLPASLLGNATAGAGRRGLGAFLAHQVGSREPVFLLLDTYEDASDEVRSWVGQHLLSLDLKPAVVVLVCGKEVPGRRNAPWAHLAREVSLGPIPVVTDWIEYVTRHYRDVPTDLATLSSELAVLLKFTKGNPGFVGALLEAHFRSMVT
jgi:hypothetical protein